MIDKIAKVLAGICVMAFFILILSTVAWGEKHRIDFPRRGFNLEIPQEWVKVPRDVFSEKIQQLKQTYEERGSEQEVPYDYAIQLKSKDWFEYPYILISVWEDVRVDRDEMPEMNEKVKESLLQQKEGINETRLEHESFDSKKFLYRINSSCNFADQQMEILKGVQYMNKGVLEMTAYMPAEMSSKYLPHVKEIMHSVELSPGNIHRKNPAKMFDFKKDILPHLNVIIAFFLVLLLLGIFVWRNRNKDT